MNVTQGQLISIDPGKHFAYWGRFDIASKAFIDAGRAKPEDFIKIGNVAVTMTIVEVPRHRGHASPVRTNDLIDEVGPGWLLAGYMRPLKAVHVYPNQWKGNGSKEKTERQVLRMFNHREKRRLYEALSEIPPGCHHNLYDAIRIGTWLLKRQ